MPKAKDDKKVICNMCAKEIPESEAAIKTQAVNFDSDDPKEWFGEMFYYCHDCYDPEPED